MIRFTHSGQSYGIQFEHREVLPKDLTKLVRGSLDQIPDFSAASTYQRRFAKAMRIATLALDSIVSEEMIKGTAQMHALLTEVLTSVKEALTFKVRTTRIQIFNTTSVITNHLIAEAVVVCSPEAG